MNRPPLGQGKAAGCPQGKEEARKAPPPRSPDPLFPPPPPHDLPSRFPQQARPSSSYPCLPSSSSANRGKTPGRQTGPPPRPPPEAALAIPSGSFRVARGGLEGPGREVVEACGGLPAAARTRCQEAQGRGGAGVWQSLRMGTMSIRRDSPWKAGLREAPGERWALGGRFLCRLCVTVRKKLGTLLGVGKRLVLGVGFASPLPFLPLGQGWTEGRGGKMGVSALPAPSPSPPGTWGLITSQKGSQSMEELSPRGRGGSRRLGRLRPDCLADSGQEGQAEGRLSDSPQHQGAVKETPRGLSRFDFRVPELCPVRRRGWGGSCPLAAPRQGMQGQDEALHRFWRGLTLVELWGPRPWVPPYPGPRDIKASAGARWGMDRDPLQRDGAVFGPSSDGGGIR
jgi:hypothetical protein